MVIDGEELKFKCCKCGHKFTRIIGYGPICPNPWMREEALRKNPPVCPKCNSRNVERETFLDSIMDFFGF